MENKTVIATLSVKERAELDSITKKIDLLAKTWVECAPLLERIRDQRLYREETKTFEEFCHKHWGWTRRYVNHVISSHVVVKQLPENLGTIVPKEGQARALGKVAPEMREKVLKIALASGKPITAKTIEIANKLASGPEVLKDEVGCPIPAGILPLWRRRDEVNGVLLMVSKVKCQIEKADKDDDPLWRECFLNKALVELQSVYANLATAKPYVVCTVCQGRLETQPDKGCRGCKGRGFMSKFRWDRVPDTIKKIRASQQEKKETK